MLGTRGRAAGDPLPRDLRDAGARDRRAAARGPRAPGAPRVEVMIPLVAYERELELVREA